MPAKKKVVRPRTKALRKPKKKPVVASSSSGSSGSDYSDSSSDYESSASRSPSPVKKTKKTNKTGKRAVSDYQKFCTKERPAIKKEHPTWKPQQVMKELGKRWSAMKK